MQRHLAVSMRDGTVALAERWYPAREEETGAEDSTAPLVIVRTPYGPGSMDRMSRALVAAGHTVLVVSCRGTFGSGGVFTPFVDELDDGRDLLTWLEDQPWAARPRVLFGASYTGHTAHALLTASIQPSAAALGVTATDVHRTVMWPHGLFALEAALVWIYGLAHQERPPLLRMLALLRFLHLRRRALETAPAAADAELLGDQSPTYQRWLTHDVENDPLWAAADRRDARPLMPPVVRVASWYDPFLLGQLEDHAADAEAGRRARLVIGSWTHSERAVERALVHEALDAFAVPSRVDGVIVHDVGMGGWRSLPSWPPPTHLFALPLRGEGDDGAEIELSWTHVPHDPPPAAGGRALDPAFAGRRRQRVREEREDVLVVTFDATNQPRVVAGAPVVVLHVPLHDEAQDWAVRLCDVAPDGTSWNVCDGVVRSPAFPGGASTSTRSGGPALRRLEVVLSPIVHTFQTGHRLRLQVAGTASPRHPSLPGPPEVRLVRSRPGSVSELRLPVLDLRAPHGAPVSGTDAD